MADVHARVYEGHARTDGQAAWRTERSRQRYAPTDARWPRSAVNLCDERVTSFFRLSNLLITYC